MERIDGLWGMSERIPGITKLLLRGLSWLATFYLMPRLALAWGWVSTNPLDSVFILLGAVAFSWFVTEALLARKRVRNIHHLHVVGNEVRPTGNLTLTKNPATTASESNQTRPAKARPTAVRIAKGAVVTGLRIEDATLRNVDLLNIEGSLEDAEIDGIDSRDNSVP